VVVVVVLQVVELHHAIAVHFHLDVAECTAAVVERVLVVAVNQFVVVVAAYFVVIYDETGHETDHENDHENPCSNNLFCHENSHGMRSHYFLMNLIYKNLLSHFYLSFLSNPISY